MLEKVKLREISTFFIFLFDFQAKIVHNMNSL